MPVLIIVCMCWSAAFLVYWRWNMAKGDGVSSRAVVLHRWTFGQALCTNIIELDSFLLLYLIPVDLGVSSLRDICSSLVSLVAILL